VIAWAVRWVLLWCGVVLLGIAILDRGSALLPDRNAPPDPRGPYRRRDSDDRGARVEHDRF
jgi:hypothetical protein